MALTSKLANIADAIREKTGDSAKLTLDGMVTAIDGIEVGGGNAEPSWRGYKAVEGSFIFSEDGNLNDYVIEVSVDSIVPKGEHNLLTGAKAAFRLCREYNEKASRGLYYIEALNYRKTYSATAYLYSCIGGTGTATSGVCSADTIFPTISYDIETNVVTVSFKTGSSDGYGRIPAGERYYYTVAFLDDNYKVG